jgi:hypothetical protein
MPDAKTTEAEKFAVALGKLCREHGVMLWTAFDTVPMVISSIQPDEMFHYEAEWSEVGLCFAIKRVLS